MSALTASPNEEHGNMSKINTLVGLTVIVGLLAITASSALASFSSENGKATKGEVKTGAITFTDEGATAACENATGQWSLEEAKEAEALNINFGASNTGWKKCTALGFKEVEVSECEFQLRTELTGWSIIKGCTIVIPGNCRIKIPSGPVNEGLEEVNTTKGSKGLKSELDVQAVSSEAESLGGLGCVGIKNLKNFEGTLKGALTASEVKANSAAMVALKRENVGGVPTRGTAECKFITKGEKCSIAFGNLLMSPQEVKSVTIFGGGGTSRFSTITAGCRLTVLLEEIGMPGATCTNEVELKVEQTTTSYNDYCVVAENRGTGSRHQACAQLRIR
jgi:hypothetical protein